MKKWVKSKKSIINTDKFIRINLTESENYWEVIGHAPNQYLEDGEIRWEETTFIEGTKEECEKYLEDLMND